MANTPDNNANIATAYNSAKTRKRVAAASGGVSLALTPFLPFMAVPAGIGIYKAHKYKKKQHALQGQLPTTHKDSDKTRTFNADVRQVTRHVSRGSLGLVIAGALAPFLPHMIVPAGVNVYLLHKAYQDTEELSRVIEDKGYRVRKRDVVRGVTRVCIEKAILVPITLGHDDFLIAIPTAALDPASDLLSAHEALVNVPGIHEINEIANAPVEMVQHALGIETAEERLADMQQNMGDFGGWHEPAEVVVENVVIGGTVAATVEYAIDRPLDSKNQGLQSDAP